MMLLRWLSYIHRLRRSSDQRMSGSVLVELALVLPIILIIAGFTVRVVQILQARQIASVLSREIATDAYRTCMDFTLQERRVDSSGIEILGTNTGATAPIITECLATIRTRYMDRWPTIRPAGTTSATVLDVRLSVYRYDFSNYSVLDQNCDADVTRIPHQGSPEVPNTDISITSMCRRNRAVRVTVSFDMTPSLVFLGLIPGVQLPDTATIRDTTEI